MYLIKKKKIWIKENISRPIKNYLFHLPFSSRFSLLHDKITKLKFSFFSPKLNSLWKGERHLFWKNCYLLTCSCLSRRSVTVGGGLCNGEGSSRGNFGRDRRYLLITAWLEAQRPVPRLIHRRADILCILFFRAFHHPPLDLSYPFFLPYFHSHPLPFFPPLLLDSIEPSRRGRDLWKLVAIEGGSQRIPFLNGCCSRDYDCR